MEKDKVDDFSNPSIWNTRAYFILFMLMGAGANWVYPTALAQEIPYFERYAPEKLCVATYMNATTNIGLFAMVIYVYFHEQIHHSVSVPSLLSLSSFGCFFTALTYSITVNNISLLLYIGCVLGGTVGALSSVIMNPFMTRFHNDFISAARSGGSAYILLTALIALAQNPGSIDESFSTRVYLIIFGFLLLLPLLAYYAITKNNLGIRPPQLNDKYIDPEKEFDNVSIVSKDNVNSHSMENGQFDNSSLESQSNFNDLMNPEHTTKFETFNMGRLSETWTKTKQIDNIIDRFMFNLIDFCLPHKIANRWPWLKATIPYMLTVGWVNFNTWGIVTALFPFAINNVSIGSGATNLALGYELGAMFLVMGDLSTTIIKIPIFAALLVFSSFCCTIYLAALNLPGFHTSAAAPMLIIIFAFQRFLESHSVTSAYRAVATNTPLVYREAATRAVGMSDQFSTTIGAVASTVLVTVLFACGTGADDDTTGRKLI
eukprot:gene5541-7660_t